VENNFLAPENVLYDSGADITSIFKLPSRLTVIQRSLTSLPNHEPTEITYTGQLSSYNYFPHAKRNSCKPIKLLLTATNSFNILHLKLSVFNEQSGDLTLLNPLTPNDDYSGRTAPLTSKRYILYIYSTNTGTEYFKHGIYCPFFSPQNAVCFIILTYLVPGLFTFYIQGVLKLKKK